MKYTITADAEPQYGRFGTSSWSCSDWKLYHKANVAKYGKVKADERFIAAFKNPDGTSFGANRAGCFGFDNDFVTYFKSVGLYDKLNDGVNGIISNAVSTTTEATKNLSEGVSDLSKGIANTTKFTKYLLPISLLIVLYVGFKFYSSKLKYIQN